MNELDRLIHMPLANALGWTLFHSLWEGAVAALFLAAILAATRSPRVRYVCACASLFALLLGFAVTLAVEVSQQRGGPAVNYSGFSGARRSGDIAPLQKAHRFPLEEFLPWLSPFWMAGVIALHLRRVAGWIGAQRLRNRGVCRPPDPWLQRFDALRHRMRISKPVALLETCLAEVPVVVGYLRPVILVPAGLLAGLPPSQMEAILLHELAHIRRHDALVNLLQNLAEAFLFYHPAVWWISGIVRSERETCCDDLAVAASGDKFDYAAALTSLEQSRTAAYENTLAATGGSLVKRIQRLLRTNDRLELAPLVSAAILVMVAAGALVAWQEAANGPAQQAVTPYTLWLNQDVAYIITPAERAAFQKLQTDPERDHFIEQFWQRRDPTPDTSRNEFKEEHYRRIASANRRFTWGSTPGWRSDRGRIYIVYGPPDELEDHPASQPYPTQQWLYHFIQGMGKNVIVEFVDPAGAGEYRMTSDPAFAH